MPAAGLLLALLGPLAEGAEQGSGPLECRPVFEPAGADYPFLRADSPEQAVPEGAIMGQVHYTRLPIFDEADPDENNALYRWANRAHILTREGVIARQVLFAPGQAYDVRLLEESARILRRQENFYDAAIRPVSLCGDVVDVEVITRDTWSLTPSLSFDRSGGQDTFSFRLEESNLLGLGKQVVLEASEDIDRDSLLLSYQDNNLLGTRMTAGAAYEDSDDGSSALLELRQPFFSLESRRAWGLSLRNEVRDDPQYRRGRKISEVRHDIEDYSVEAGVSGGLRGGSVLRWTLGYRYRADTFAPADELLPPAPFPRDRELSYPYLGLEWIEDDFTTAFNLDRLYRTEDLHLGLRLRARIGYAASALGSEGNWIVLDGEMSDTLRYTGDDLLQHSLAWEGTWEVEDQVTEDLLLSYEARYFRRQTEDRSFFAGLRASWSRNLNSHRQVVLGGENGARGFRNRLQTGDRHAVLSLEERVYTDIHLFNLIRVGGALFLDVGRAWEPGADNGTEESLLADAGFGLRLASSKASSSRILHIDFAFPLTNRDDPEVDSFLVAVNIKGAF